MNFPAIKSLRRLDQGLKSIRDLPVLLPPNTTLTDTGNQYNYPSFHIQENPYFVFKKDSAFSEDFLDGVQHSGDVAHVWARPQSSNGSSDSEEEDINMLSTDEEDTGLDIHEEMDWTLDQDTDLKVLAETRGS